MLKQSTLRALAATLLAAAATGCAITSGHHMGPNGRPVHMIDGMSARVAFEKANELCPSGYSILGMPMQTSLIDYVMTIECKAEGTSGAMQANVDTARAAANAPPVPPASAKQPIALGRDDWQADKALRGAGCGSKAQASLTSRGPGFELYSATCIGGDVMKVRCEMGSCTVVQ